MYCVYVYTYMALSPRPTSPRSQRERPRRPKPTPLTRPHRVVLKEKSCLYGMGYAFGIRSDPGSR